MKQIFATLALRFALIIPLLGLAGTAKAQTSADEPIITFKTNIYDTYGESNQFSLVIGTVEPGQYIDIDCGYGKIEYETQQAVIDSLYQISGTMISCQVSKEGIVKIYGDASQIDYFNASGCYISWIEFANPASIDILDLSHNELQSLDLTEMTNAQALYLSDNTFSEATPLKIGPNKPNLKILEVNTIEYMDESFNLSDYPSLVSFDGYHNQGLKKCDPSGCPELMRLTLDVTPVESIDVTHNPKLLILNVSNTRITSLDLSKNPYLTELYCDHAGSYNHDYKLESLDITNNTELVHLFCSGNRLTSLDISKCPKLVTLAVTDNYLTNIDVSNNPELYIVEINKNCFDFATLPLDPGTWNTYYYGQRNFPVEKSYKAGTVFDYSSRVLREGTITEAILYSVSETSPESPSPVDESYYTYADGILTVKDIPQDSVYIAFANSAFPDELLRTDKFKIKSEADYGKDVKVFSFTTSVTDGNTMSFGIGIQGATADNPVEFHVNFGDGNMQTFTATSTSAPAAANVTGTRTGYGPIEVYMQEGQTISAIDIRNIPMYSADVTAAATLRTLRLMNAGLYSIDLSWNRCLELLDLTGNNLSSLSLAGNNGSYEKNSLRDINLSHNKLTDLTLNNVQAIKSINLSHNQLTSIDLSDADYILSADLSNNQFETLDFTWCSMLTRLDVSHNNLTSIVLPTESSISYLACNDNRFTLATLPEHGNIKEENYIYAPQSDLTIPTKGPGIDLSAQNRIINGVGTVYIWKDTSGNTLVEGTDYTNDNGRMVFRNTEAGNIVCEMTNASFPDFTGDKVFKTTPIEAAGMPTNVIATFTTVNDNEAVSLSLAAEKSGTAIYIGWDGNENLSQYMLETTYKLFTATTKANTEVKVYTYEPTEKITVFSISGATLSSCDVSRLTDAICINISDAGLSEIKLPESSPSLKELILDGNKFSEFDFSNYTGLTTLSMNKNELTTIDVTSIPGLQLLSASYNMLSDIKLANDDLWALYLEANDFKEITLDGAPNITQLSLAQNQLSQINLDALPKLRVLSLNNNNFTFKTLPLHKSSYMVYYYANQAPIDVTAEDGVIDLSDQREVDGTATVYRWFLDAPTENEEGELDGEELIIDTEYTLTEGITTFLRSFENVMCVMTNEKLPEVYIYTNLFDVTAAGIETVGQDSDRITVTASNNTVTIRTSVSGLPVNLYKVNGSLSESAETISGETVITGVESGIHVLTVGNKSYKVLVK